MSELMHVLTIDGPGGSGKGTIMRAVATHLGWHMLDSGAIYRALAMYAKGHDCELDDIVRLEDLACQLPLTFKGDKIYLDGLDVTTLIRTEEVGTMASKLAELHGIRAVLLARQRAFYKAPGLVADGRDMGTVVFPNAFLKVYLDANPEERAKRRFLQLKAAGYNVTLQNLVTEIKQRDERDKMRAAAPLKPPADALVIDSSGMSISEVSEFIIAEARQRLSKQ